MTNHHFSAFGMHGVETGFTIAGSAAAEVAGAAAMRGMSVAEYAAVSARAAQEATAQRTEARRTEVQIAEAAAQLAITQGPAVLEHQLRFAA
jgi:hypothetical protein